MEVDLNYRRELEKEAEEYGLEVLYNRAKEIDPEAMEKVSANDKKRITRVLEIYNATGRNKTELEKKSRKEVPYNYLIFGINMERSILYDRINKRVDIMLEQGLIEEVKNLINKYSNMPTAMQGLGYKEVKEFLDGNISKEEMIEKIKMETRRYAKRQITWFKRIENIIWLDGLNKTEENVNSIMEVYGE